jgi:hypothetical protein
MTPTADDRGGSLSRTRREAVFYLGMKTLHRSWQYDGTDVVRLDRSRQQPGIEK